MPVTDQGDLSPTPLLEVLGQARDAGFLGPGPLQPHLRHAEGFATLARRLAAAASGGVQSTDGPSARLLDLGSGGGLPGLVVATRWAEANVTLLDANGRRTEFLRRAVRRLGLTDRVSVLLERAETTGRDPSSRGKFDGIVVRSFGVPAVVAECAAPLLHVGGWLIVSEPPGAPESGPGAPGASGVAGGAGGSVDVGTDRWPTTQLAHLGMEPGEFVKEEFGYQVVWLREPCPDRYPRRNGVPAKNPLF